ncbi:MAG: TolC family protein [Prevotella sp.]|nr:TolC family protein [Prevotella sp.]
MKQYGYLLVVVPLFLAGSAAAQPWTAQRCMEYAVTHNHSVRQARLELDNYKAARRGAVGRFLPSLDASVGTQYNFGRAIDPETNTYTDVSTFYNGYSVNASLPVFDGFSRLHALKAAKAAVLMGRNALRQQQDQTAISTLQAFADAAYYKGLVTMAEEKQKEAGLLLRQTQLMEQVGRKSAADVAEVASQKAEADYNLTRQQNLHAAALLELKTVMGLPVTDSLEIIGTPPDHSQGEECLPLRNQFISHYSLLISHFRMEVARHEWRQAHASVLPALSVTAGLSTTYYKTLHSPMATPFTTQLQNNMGQYVGATLSIPIFNRLQSLTAIRRAKNNYRIACEAYEEKRLELLKLATQAAQDLHAYLLQTQQMEKKVAADSLAYELTRRQYEEGLSTAIDLHTMSAQLLNSKATLLQCQLMVMVKKQLVRYYNGEQIWTEE